EYSQDGLADDRLSRARFTDQRHDRFRADPKRNPRYRADEAAWGRKAHMEVSYLKKIGHAASPAFSRKSVSSALNLTPRACKLAAVAGLNDRPRNSASPPRTCH